MTDIEKYEYDVKYAYHVVRLVDEAEQLLRDGELDLGRSADRLREVRRGESSS